LFLVHELTNALPTEFPPLFPQPSCIHLPPPPMKANYSPTLSIISPPHPPPPSSTPFSPINHLSPLHPYPHVHSPTSPPEPPPPYSLPTFPPPPPSPPPHRIVLPPLPTRPPTTPPPLLPICIRRLTFLIINLASPRKMKTSGVLRLRPQALVPLRFSSFYPRPLLCKK